MEMDRYSMKLDAVGLAAYEAQLRQDAAKRAAREALDMLADIAVDAQLLFNEEHGNDK